MRMLSFKATGVIMLVNDDFATGASSLKTALSNNFCFLVEDEKTSELFIVKVISAVIRMITVPETPLRVVEFFSEWPINRLIRFNKEPLPVNAMANVVLG
ncbi:hypothetical protein D3C80_286870 [compost metagenome]